MFIVPSPSPPTTRMSEFNQVELAPSIVAVAVLPAQSAMVPKAFETRPPPLMFSVPSPKLPTIRPPESQPGRIGAVDIHRPRAARVAGDGTIGTRDLTAAADVQRAIAVAPLPTFNPKELSHLEWSFTFTVPRLPAWWPMSPSVLATRPPEVIFSAGPKVSNGQLTGE